MNNESDTITPPIHISSFAYNSSILWDPERWGRTSSLQDTSQVIRFLVSQFLKLILYYYFYLFIFVNLDIYITILLL